MGKLTAEDKATLERLQKMQEEPDDDDSDYVWVRSEATGHTIRLHGERARAYCRRNGIDLDEAADSTKADPVTADGKKGPPAKKAAAAKKTPAGDAEAGDAEAGDDIEQDPPARTAPRTFF